MTKNTEGVFEKRNCIQMNLFLESGFSRILDVSDVGVVNPIKSYYKSR